jgi:membrane peptidoglycan carboxypeptidase
MANILGTASPHVIDMANAFATIAAKGQRATPYLITKVTSADGGIDYKVEKHLTPAFDQLVTADVTDAMTRVVSRGGTGAGALELGRPAAGKTGTTDRNLAVWFDGFTPQLAAAVGMYQGKGESTDSITVAGINEVTGGTFPVKIWTAFMKGALQGQKVIDFPKPAGLGDDTLPTPTMAPTTTAPTTTAPTTTAPTTTAPTTAPPTTAPPTVAPTKAPQPTAPPTIFEPTATAPAARPGPAKVPVAGDPAASPR